MAYMSTEDMKHAYEQFFRDFKNIEGEFKYINKVNRMIRDDQRSLVIDYQDLILMDDIYEESDLSDSLLQLPRQMIQAGGQVLADFVKTENPEFYKIYRSEKFFVRFDNLPRQIKIRDIRAKDVDDIYWLEGIIIRTTEIKSIIDKAVFICDENPEHVIELTLEDGVFVKPQRCIEDTCSSKKFHIDQKNSVMVDWQFITLQEKPEDLPPGASPKSIPCQLTEDVVNAVRPGDRVNMGGIIRSRPSKSMKSGQLLTFDNWIEVNFVESATKDDELTEITPDEEQEFLEMARDHHIFDHLLQSLAPQIHGLKEVKQAALLMLFGGVDKTYPDGFSTRGQPNVLLVGDPGVAKSQLLRYVQSIAPRGLYTSGKGSSAAGLTAAIIRDPDSGEITLEAGAMVLADRGVCLIDEFDKMNENDRSAIHEAMEQHSYHPSVEITFADGSVSSIGEFVDHLFATRSDKVVEGINCEILPLEENHRVLSTDFNQVDELPVDRVSRHEAPAYFYEISFSHGRSILVTPEHPVYVYDHGITTLEASEISEGMYVPGPRRPQYQSHGDESDITVSDSSNLPECLTTDLAVVLGYILGATTSYDNKSSTLHIETSSHGDMTELEDIIRSITGTDLSCSQDGTQQLTINSSELFSYFEQHFPEILEENQWKRVPRQVFAANYGNRVAFLSALFTANDTTKSGTQHDFTSDRLVRDIQDLLHTLGIYTTITTRRITSGGLEDRYRLAIVDESTDRFDTLLVSSNLQPDLDIANLRLDNQDRSGRLPTQIRSIIDECIDYFGIADIIRENQLLVTDDGLKRTTIVDLIDLFTDQYQSLAGSEVVAEDSETGQFQTSYHSDSELQDIRAKIDYLDKLVDIRWATVTSVDKIPNAGRYQTDWVYDVTVEPTENFVSHGLFLHNTVSVAKAGIVATLNARTGVLAAANPKYGRYEDNRPFNENVNLSPAILSRFDLVFIMRDIPEEERDSVLADHILKLHRFHGSTESNRPPLEEEQLKKYIAYAKRNFSPQLSQEASELLETFYVNMRNSYGSATENPKDRITITARQLEGIIRLAEARAKASLKNEVTKNDAQFAIELMEYSLGQIATDPETGTLDIDALYSGQTQSRRSRLTRLQKVIDFVHKDAGGEFSEQELIDAALTEGLSEEYVTGAIRQMVRDGALYQPRSGKLDKP